MNPMGADNNGWSEWSKHILKELERLNSNYESLNEKIDNIKNTVHIEMLDMKDDIAKIEATQYSLEELKAWKKTYDDEAVINILSELKAWKLNMSDVVTPTQLDSHIKDIGKLKTFKIQAVTIFLVFQALFGVAIALLKIYG